MYLQGDLQAAGRATMQQQGPELHAAGMKDINDISI